MSQVQTHATEPQKKMEPARHLEQESARQPEQRQIQQVAPQAAYRCSQDNGNGLRPVDLLALQRVVGNRQVQLMMARSQAKQRHTVALSQNRPSCGQIPTVQRVEGGQWSAEHESASREAAASAAIGATMVQGDTELFQGYILSPDPDRVEQVLKAIIAERGFKGAESFVMDYRFIGGVSRIQRDLRDKIQPILDESLTKLKNYAQKYVENTFYQSARDHLIGVLQDSEKVIDKEAEKYGLKTTIEHPWFMGGASVPSYSLAKNKNTVGMVSAAKNILDQYNRLSELNKKRESLEERIPIYDSEESGTQLKRRSTGRYSIRIMDQAAHQRVSEELKKAQQEYIQVRSSSETAYPILASFRPPEGLSNLRTIAEGAKGGGATTIGLEIAKKRKNIEKIRAVADDGKFIWKQESIIRGTKKVLGVQPGSIEDRAVEAKVAAVEHSASLRNLTIAFLSLIGALLAAIPTAGGSLVAWGAASAGTGLLVGAASVSLYEGIHEYQIQQAATGTAFDRAQAISQQDPSLFWLAIAIVGAIADIGQAAVVFSKAARTIRTLEKVAHTEEAAHNAYRSAGLSGVMSEDEFVQHFIRNMKAETIGTATKARSALMEQLAKRQHPDMAALVSGDEGAMLKLLKSHGKWEALIADLQAGNEEMQQIVTKLVAYRQREVIDEINKRFGGQLLPGSGKMSGSDLDFSLVSEAGIGAGEKLMKAETYMVSKFGSNWEEMLRVNFYTDLRSRLLITQEIEPLLSVAEKAKMAIKEHELSTKFNLARRLQDAQSDATAIARVEQDAQMFGIDLADIRKLASMGKDAARLQRNVLLLKIDALEAQYRTVSGSRKIELAQQIQSMQMEANFYTKEAVIAPGAALELTGSKAKGLQLADAIMEWTAMLEHKVGEYGNIVNAMWEYEPWKYIDRQLEFALRAKLDPQLIAKLEILKNRANYIYKMEREWVKEVRHIGGIQNVERVNRELYNHLLSDMRAVAIEIRRWEMEDLISAPRGSGRAPSKTSVPKTGTPGNRAASVEAASKRAAKRPPTSQLPASQQTIRDSLLHEHPGLNPTVATEAAKSGAKAMGSGGKGADVVLINGGGREVSVHSGAFTSEGIGSHLQAEAAQVNTTEIYLQINSAGATKAELLQMISRLRNAYPELRGILVKIFGSDGSIWWSGAFSGPL